MFTCVCTYSKNINIPTTYIVTCVYVYVHYIYMPMYTYEYEHVCIYAKECQVA